MLGMLKTIKSVDLVSSEIIFNYHGKSKFKSYIGASLTIIIFAITFIVTVKLAIPLFNYSTPKISLSNLYQNNTFLNLSINSPMLIFISDAYGNLLPNQDQYLTITGISSYFVYNSNKTISIKPRPIKVQKCTQDIFMNQFRAKISKN